MYKQLLNEIYEDLEPTQFGTELELSKCKELLESINNNANYLTLQEKEQEVYELLDTELLKEKSVS